MLVAGFAIGSALSLIVLVSATNPVLADSLNSAWAHSLAPVGLHIQSTRVVTDSFLFVLPPEVQSFALAYFTNLQAPAVDSLTFMVIMVLAFASMCLRLFGLEPAEEKAVTIKFVAEEYAIMTGGLFVGLLLIALAPLAAANQS